MSREVSFKSSKDGVLLNGAFVSVKNPKGTALFIGGSGKTDRDETVDETQTYSGKKEKLFKQLAEALAEGGYSSFRYDKRGVLDENGQVNLDIWAKADREHLISDAVDAADFLKNEFSVRQSNLIIVGHSEGTIIGVEAAISLKEEIKGLVLLGAQARSMKDMLYYQIVESPYTASSGQNQKAVEEYLMAIKMIENSTEKWAPDGKPMAWYRQFLNEPANQERIQLVKSPIAIFQGEDDFSTPEEEVERFKKLGMKNLTIRTYLGLGHCFSPNRDEKPTYGPIDPKVIEDIISAVNLF